MTLSVIDSLFALSAVGVPTTGEPTSSPSHSEGVNFEQTLGELVELVHADDQSLVGLYQFAQHSFELFVTEADPEFVDQTVSGDAPHSEVEPFAPSDDAVVREQSESDSPHDILQQQTRGDLEVQTELAAVDIAPSEATLIDPSAQALTALDSLRASLRDIDTNTFIDGTVVGSASLTAEALPTALLVQVVTTGNSPTPQLFTERAIVESTDDAVDGSAYLQTSHRIVLAGSSLPLTVRSSPGEPLRPVTNVSVPQAESDSPIALQTTSRTTQPHIQHAPAYTSTASVSDESSDKSFFYAGPAGRLVTQLFSAAPSIELSTPTTSLPILTDSEPVLAQTSQAVAGNTDIPDVIAASRLRVDGNPQVHLQPIPYPLPEQTFDSARVHGIEHSTVVNSGHTAEFASGPAGQSLRHQQLGLVRTYTQVATPVPVATTPRSLNVNIPDASAAVGSQQQSQVVSTPTADSVPVARQDHGDRIPLRTEHTAPESNGLVPTHPRRRPFLFTHTNTVRPVGSRTTVVPPTAILPKTTIQETRDQTPSAGQNASVKIPSVQLSHVLPQQTDAPQSTVAENPTTRLIDSQRTTPKATVRDVSSSGQTPLPLAELTLNSRPIETSDLTTHSLPTPVAGQVTEALSRALQAPPVPPESVRELTLQLDPPELGALRIVLRNSDQGMQVNVEAADEVTLEMLSRRVPEMEQLLRTERVELQKLTVQHLSSDAGDSRPLSSGFDRSGHEAHEGHAEQQSRRDQHRNQNGMSSARSNRPAQKPTPKNAATAGIRA